VLEEVSCYTKIKECLRLYCNCSCSMYEPPAPTQYAPTCILMLRYLSGIPRLYIIERTVGLRSCPVLAGGAHRLDLTLTTTGPLIMTKKSLKSIIYRCGRLQPPAMWESDLTKELSIKGVEFNVKQKIMLRPPICTCSENQETKINDTQYLSRMRNTSRRSKTALSIISVSLCSETLRSSYPQASSHFPSSEFASNSRHSATHFQ
jgi:hypothetical protein